MKRSAGDMSPSATASQKRYQWDSASVPTQNRYSVLSQESAASTQDHQDPKETPEKTDKVPPIFIQNSNTVNYKLLIKDIQSQVHGKFNTEINRNNQIKIILESVDDYRNLTKFYDNNNVEYYSFQQKNDRPLSVVLKMVPESLANDEIKQELEKLDLPVISVTRLLYKKEPTTTCAVLLTAGDSAKEIFKVQFLFNSRIYVEYRKKSTQIPQCFNCQRYGHTKNYCKLESRCVKCSENHPKGSCQKTTQQKPFCWNCKGEHPASYRGCPHHIALLQKRNNLKQNNTFTSTKTSANKTYAQATNPTEKQSNNMFDGILVWLKQLFLQFLPQIQNFISNQIIPTLLHTP